MKQFSSALLQNLWKFFDIYLLKYHKDGVILCISGGIDSRCLLESLSLWPNRFNNIVVASVNHETQKESKEESVFICKRAKMLGFDAYVLQNKIGINLNECDLRKNRYNILFSLAKELHISALVMAHSQNDQAENIFMTITGIDGGFYGNCMTPLLLCPIIDFYLNKGCLIRPLLNFSRNYLLLILSELGVHSYFEDLTNKYTRRQRIVVRNLINENNISLIRISQCAETSNVLSTGIKQMFLQFIYLKKIDKMILCLKICPYELRPEILKIALKYFFPGKNFRGMFNLFVHFFREKVYNYNKNAITFPFGKIIILKNSYIILKRIN